MPELISHNRLIEFAGLDITAQPHPAGIYESIFTVARKLRTQIKILGTEYGELSEIEIERDKEGNAVAITGAIYRFTKIDEDADWFDRRSGEPASEDQIEDISIPPGLSPNTKVIYWHFNVKMHRLVFIKKNGKATLSPRQAETFFQSLFDQALVNFRETNSITVTTIKSPDKIDEIFRSAKVTHLTITLKQPNPDGPEAVRAQLISQMEEEGVALEKTELHSHKNGTIKRSPRLNGLLRASVTLGSAQAVTFDSSGERKVINTENHPQVITEKYEPALNIPFLTFFRRVVDLFNRYTVTFPIDNESSDQEEESDETNKE